MSRKCSLKKAIFSYIGYAMKVFLWPVTFEGRCICSFVDKLALGKVKADKKSRNCLKECTELSGELNHNIKLQEPLARIELAQKGNFVIVKVASTNNAPNGLFSTLPKLLFFKSPLTAFVKSIA